MAKETLFGGDWQKVLIKVVLLLLVLLLIYYGINKLMKFLEKAKDREEKEDVLNEQMQNPPAPIEVPNIDSETITDNDALDIANKLEVAMTGSFGTDEDAMMNLLQCLDGASLQKVKFEFGVRDYDGDPNKPYDLFDFFNQELDGNLTSAVYYSPCVEGCEDWSSAFFSTGCYERPYMRIIWERSGLPITF